MKKIITAIENQNLNKELKKDKDFHVICNNIQYREAIIDILKINKNNNINIDILVIDEKIPGEINYYDLINNILKINNKIKIIFILYNENMNLKEILNKINNVEIYYEKNIDIKFLVQFLKKEKNKVCKNNSNKKNQNKLRNYEINNNNLKNNKKELINNYYEISKKVQENSLIIIGDNEEFKEKIINNFVSVIDNKKILIINFNVINYKNKKMKLNKNIDLIFSRNIIYSKNINIENYLNNFLKKYSLIILDFNLFNYLFLIDKFKDNKNIILLIENNLNKIKLDYSKINKIIKNKNIKIILNKINKNIISNNILKIIFKNIKIIGQINLNKKNNYKKIIKKINK